MLVKEAPKSQHHPYHFIQEDWGEVDEKTRNSQSFMRKSVLHAVEAVFALLISRMCCLLYSWRLLSYNTTLCGSLISSQIGSQNFLRELKIQTRGQYVFYKLHKTEV